MSVLVPPRESVARNCPRPADVARGLAASGDCVWLDSSQPDGDNLSLVAGEPAELLRGRLPEDQDLLRRVLRRHGKPGGGSHPGAPAGGLFGHVGFDGRFVFGVFHQCHVFQHRTGSWVGDSTAVFPQAAAGTWGAPPPASLDFTPLLHREQFVSMVRRAQEYIAAGDIYQVNLSFPWVAPWPEGAAPWAYYESLRSHSPSPYGAYLQLGGQYVCSASPECFLRVSANHILTRPIKGTRPRDPCRERDAELAEELLQSVKERSELVMITDLERNDLGQVCEFGSVQVTGLLKLERFAQVQHLVSTVVGRLRPAVDHLDAFLACFPGGSISGAPKKRALEIIGELETHARGLYTGAIGYFGFNGESQFSIAIRTAWLEGGTLRFHTGAGIVADSDPDSEYDETLHKALGLLGAARFARAKAVPLCDKPAVRPG